MQEINVALGGDIHQKLYAVGDFDDHREDSTDPVDVQYGESHSVRLVAGSWLADVLQKDEITTLVVVNKKKQLKGYIHLHDILGRGGSLKISVV
jgi:gamma-glutamyl-gamma-aminobutyrate hydrolase PuuD